MINKGDSEYSRWKKTSWDVLNWGGDIANSFKRAFNIFIYYIIFMIPIIILGILFKIGIFTGLITGITILFTNTVLIIVFIIYGVYFWIYTGFTFYLLVEGRVGVIDLIKKSISMVKENKTLVWSFYSKIIGYSILFGLILVIIIHILSTMNSVFDVIIPITLGPVFMIINTWINVAMGHLYRQIDSDVKVNNIEEEMKEM